MKSAFRITVVAATRNRLTLLRRMLEALREQTLGVREFAVVLSDDGSTDGTVEFLADEAAAGPLALTVVHGKRGGPARSRNRALAKVDSPFVAFTDDDTIPAPDWLESHLKFLQDHPEFAGVGGRITRVNDTAVGRYIDFSGAMRHPERPDGSIGYLVTANAAYRTAWLQRVNGFNESITWPGGEDPDLAFRVSAAGGRLGLVLDAGVLHHHRDTLSGISQMFYYHGKGLAMNIRSGTKQRDTSAFRLLMGGLVRGSREVLSSRVSWRDKPLFLLCNGIRSFAFARGFAAIMQGGRGSGAR